MTRYWVNLGHQYDSGVDGGGDVGKHWKKASDELEKLADHFTETGMSFVTEDLGKAREVIKQAMGIYAKHGIAFEGIGITTLPECPKCGKYSRFSDKYCPRCSTKLTPSKEIE